MDSVILALALMTINPNKLPEQAADVYKYSRHDMVQLAVAMEYIEPHEVVWYDSNTCNFSHVWFRIHDRYEDLKDAPHSYHMHNFQISYSDLCIILKMQAEVSAQFEREKAWAPYWATADMEDAMELLNRRYRAWNTLCSLKGPYFGVTAHRLYLKELKEAIGDADFYAGRMPPPIPLELIRP